MRALGITARTASSLVVAVVLSACGAGGGSVPATTSVTSPQLADRTLARADAQAMLAAAKIVVPGGYYPGLAPIGAFAVLRHPSASRRAQSGPCGPGGTSGIGSTMIDINVGADGDWTSTYTDFYDASCTQRERVTTLRLPPPAGILDRGPILATGTTTAYDRTGAVIAFSAVQVSYSETFVTVQTADAKTVGGPVVARSAATCTTAQPASGPETCSLAAWSTAGTQTTGVTETVGVSFGPTPGAASTRATAQISATVVSGAPLTIVASGTTAWTITGGTPIGALSGLAFADYYGFNLVDTGFEMTDALNGLESHSATIGPAVGLNLDRAATPFAALHADADGIGTITYASDGATEPIAGFTIFG
jgi:hypothetical protein